MEIFVLPQQSCGIIISNVIAMMNQGDTTEKSAGSYFRRLKGRFFRGGEINMKK